MAVAQSPVSLTSQGSGNAAPLLRIGLAAALAGLVYVVAADAVRRFEASALSFVGGRLMSSIGHAVPSVSGVVIDGPDEPFVLIVTTSCSATTVVAAVWFIGLAFFRSNIWRRLVALCVAAPFMVFMNVARLVFVASVGSRWGIGSLVIVHDWLGTFISLITGVAGLSFVVCVGSHDRAATRGRL